MKQRRYRIKRVVIEYYYVVANSKKEALDINGKTGNPAEVIIKSETVTKLT